MIQNRILLRFLLIGLVFFAILPYILDEIVTQKTTSDTTYQYYPDSSIKAILITHINPALHDTTLHVTEYYDNGIISEKGRYKSGNKTGLWIENYKDGTLKWHGNYSYGIPRYDNVDTLTLIRPKLVIEGNSDTLIMDSTYNLRFETNGMIHPSDRRAVSTGSSMKKITHDNYDYTLTPKQKGEIKVFFSLRSPKDFTSILLSKDTLIVKQ